MAALIVNSVNNDDSSMRSTIDHNAGAVKSKVINAFFGLFPWLKDNTHQDEAAKKLDPAPILGFDVMTRVMMHLDSTDLCFASNVSPLWQKAADDELVWKHRCETDYGRTCTHKIRRTLNGKLAWKRTYLLLDDAVQLFNGNVDAGTERLMTFCHLDLDHIITLFSESRLGFIKEIMIGRYLGRFTTNKDRSDGYVILNKFVSNFNFEGLSLHSALRVFLKRVHMTSDSARSRDRVMRCFCQRYLDCNSDISEVATQDQIFIMSCSILILSVDLSSDVIVKKMSKEGFTKMTIRTLEDASSDRIGRVNEEEIVQDSRTDSGRWRDFALNALDIAYDDLRENGHITQKHRRLRA